MIRIRPEKECRLFRRQPAGGGRRPTDDRLHGAAEPDGVMFEHGIANDDLREEGNRGDHEGGDIVAFAPLEIAERERNPTPEEVKQDHWQNQKRGEGPRFPAHAGMKQGPHAGGNEGEGEDQ